MKAKNCMWQRVTLTTALLAVAAAPASAQVFTVQIGTPAAAPTALVNHGDAWLYRKGTNAPAANWQTLSDGSLDSSWVAGTGGFGYSTDTPAETNNCRTILTDMFNGPYTTIYIRKSFEVTNAPDPAQRLLLRMDWDDGFVAYLDGAEVQRQIAPGATGVEPAFNALATGSHESSLGTSGNAPVTYDLGPVGSRLAAGTHVLALIGLNRAANSTDLVLVSDLSLTAISPVVTSGKFFAIVHSNSVPINGTNTLPGSARVLVDGVDAVFNPGSGAWSKTVSLSPGFNRLLIQAVDASGVPLYSTNADVVSELASSYIGGTLGSSTTLNSLMGVVHVTNTVVVPPGGSLTVGPGTVVMLNAGLSILATNATLTLTGTPSDAVYFVPSDGTTVWGGTVGNGIFVSGTNGHLLMQHGETIAGNIDIWDGGVALIEDCYLHDYEVSSPPIVHCRGTPSPLIPCQVTMRRCHIARYYEINLQISTNHIEDCLGEYQGLSGDGIDYDAARPGSTIRRCTLRHGRLTNTDALDMGEFSAAMPSDGVLIEECLLYDFIDKGISVGYALNITARNCLVHNVNSGMVSKDSSTATFYNNTILKVNFAFDNYQKIAGAGGGHSVTYNNILSSNPTNVVIDGLSTITVDYSDLHGSTWSGTGNISSDPLLLNEAQFDHRLHTNSPAIGAGQGGETMGCLIVPVGARMAPSHPTFDSVAVQDGNVTLTFYVDTDKTYTVQRSDSASGGPWMKVVDVFPHPLPYLTTITNALAGQHEFYRIVTPRQP